MISEEELLNQLETPIKSFKLFALEEIIQEGCSENLIAQLERLQARETDEECSLLFSHAIGAIKKRLGETQDGASPVADVTTFFQQFAGAGPVDRLSLLRAMNSRSARELAPQAPDWFAREASPLVAAAMLKTFGKFWPKEKINDIASRLLAPSASLRLAALEVLVRWAPDQLVKALPTLLTSDDPRTRALAVAGLAQIDLEEAVLHLEALLMSSDPHHRLAGLQNAFYLPVERTIPLLLKFLAAESDPRMLERAGIILLSNPDLETPYRLWKIAEISPPAKAPLIKKILTELCKIIKDAGLVEGDFQAYLNRLQAWIQKRGTLRFVQSCLQSLSIEEGEPDPELMTLITGGLQKAELRMAFQEAMGWPISEKGRARLRTLLEEEKPPAPPGPFTEKIPSPASVVQSPSTPTSGEVGDLQRRNLGPDVGQVIPVVGQNQEGQALGPVQTALSLQEDLIRKMSSLKPADAEQARGDIEGYLRKSDVSEDLKAASLRTALRLNLAGFSGNAEKGLASGNAKLVSAAMEYLGTHDPDKFYLYLGKLLSKPNQRIKTTALKILGNAEPREALSRVTAMLKLPHREQQLGAISCLVIFEFTLVRDLLGTFLETSRDRELFDSGLCVFASNPEPENLYPLFVIEKKTDPIYQRNVAQVRRETCQILESQGVLTSTRVAGLEKEFLEKLRKEEERKKTPPPLYSLKTLQASQLPANVFHVAAFGRELLQRFALHVIILVVILAFGLWNLFSSTTPIARIEAGTRITISGKIIDRGIEPGEIIIRSESGTRFLFDIGMKKAGKYKVGERINAVLVPYRTTDGFVLARVEQLDTIKE